MGKPLMIQEEDERRIETLKRRLKIARKVDVLRAGIEPPLSPPKPAGR
jgi:hypothetical protein